jgi:hypothetical protein
MRYFIGFLVTIGLIILFTGGDDNKSREKDPKKPPQTTSQLAEYATSGSETRLVISGPIKADAKHEAVRITVNANDVVYEQIQGYEGKVLNQQTYANNQDAYRNFLYALGRSGFTRGDATNKALASEKGQCPLGSRYVFELLEGDGPALRWWATSCGDPTTYKGNVETTLDLFRAQVPDYDTLTRDLDI